MKINYKNPVTDKWSSVVLDDYWLLAYEDACSIVDFEYDPFGFVESEASYYFTDSYPVDYPVFKTFTKALEYSLSLFIRDAMVRPEVFCA